MRNVCLVVCYDGTRYRGWQRLKQGDDTIQGKLETVLSRILEEPIELIGSGRTDAGVHAENQVANFHCENEMPCAQILSLLRRYLPEDIGIRSCKEVAPRFHARIHARQKTYRYRLWCSEQPCVFERRFVTVMPDMAQIEPMRKAANLLLGEHDFSAFCTNAGKKKSTVRRLDAIEITQSGDELHFTLTSDGFLHHMVRIVVGTLVEVGRGQRDAASVAKLFGAPRSAAGVCMPPQGLCLMEVRY